MSEHTTTPLRLSRDSRVTIPLALVAGLIATTAIGYAAWSSTREQVERNTDDIKTLTTEQRVLRETIYEMRADLKYLVRERRDNPKN